LKWKAELRVEEFAAKHVQAVQMIAEQQSE